MILLFPFLLVNSVASISQYQDCTNQFKNQIAMLEYRFYPGWWSTPDSAHLLLLEFANDRTDAKANKNLHFTLHDCGENTVCIESSKSGYNGYYLHVEYAKLLRIFHETTLYDVKQNLDYKHKIYCTSCQPDSDTYHDCQIYHVQTQRYWYTGRDGHHGVLPLAQGYPNWFQWRIVSPATREYWAQVSPVENCMGSEDLPAFASFHTSISNSVTTTTTVEQNIEFGLEAIPFLEKLGETKMTWSRANVRTWAQSVTTTLGSAGTNTKMVKPGMKWFIEQFVGEAAFNTIKTDKYRVCDIPCSSNSYGCS